MKKVLIAFFSRTGTTEKMAEYIAEGVRIAGHEADLKKTSDLRNEKDLAGYDGYIVGGPTYHLDMPQPLKTFFAMTEKADLKGKVGAAFSSRSHPSSDGGAAATSVFDVMESKLKMRMTNLGPFDLEARLIDTAEGMHTCQDYGKAVGEMFGPE
jgi:flavodoxin